MTESTLKLFVFEEEMTLRATELNGHPAFVTADVCRVLGTVNVSQAVQALDDDEKGICSIYTLGGHQELSVVTESGLSILILRSRDAMKKGTLPHRFWRWITSDVLPALREKGSYTLPDTPLPKRPCDEWPLEEWRTKIAAVNAACRVLNRGSAAWMWKHVGLPVPPRHLLPVWWQAELLPPTLTPPA